MKVEHKIFAAFIVGFLAVALVGAATYYNANSLLKRNDLVVHTYRALSAIDDVLGGADEIQSGARGYLLTGKKEYLQPYHAGIVLVDQSIVSLRTLTSDNPVQQRELDRLQAAVNRTIAGTEAELNARDQLSTGNMPVSIGIQDKENMDQVRLAIVTMKQHENVLLAQRDRDLQTGTKETLTNFAILLVLAVLLLGLFYMFIRHDLAVRRRTDRALRDSDSKIRGVMDSAPDAMLITSIDGTIQMVNAEAERLFGYLRHEFPGRKLETFLVGRRAPEEERPDAIRLSNDLAIQTLRAMGARFDGIRQDGTTFPTDLSRSPVQVGGEALLITSVRDRTEQQRAEEAMQKFSLDLARSNAELERFAYVASHDLQEPLRMVSSYTLLLAKRYKGKLDPNADEFIGYAVDGASRMQKLINDLLALSRVGTQAKPSEPVDTGTVLARVLSDLRTTIETAEASIVSPERMPIVLADPTQIGQLFQNLVGNALKFRGSKSPRVEIVIRREVDSNFWRFSFNDNGIGIEPQYFERIFVIFQRLHSKESYPGTGIGLAICKKIVERHGGELSVTSIYGKGATFSFTLPAASC